MTTQSSSAPVPYTDLKNPSYRPRVLDRRIAEGLELFGAVCIQGPKYCGKTWSGRSISNSEINLMDPAGNFANRATATLAPDLALQGASPRLVDEWQEVPQLWDGVRSTVDASGKERTFVLTGSATPRLAQPLHSGVGRIEKIRMRPMTLAESGMSNASVSLRGLFNGEVPRSVAPTTSLEDLATAVVVGGWPGSLGLAAEQGRRVVQNYVDTLRTSDLSRVDGTRRDPAKIQRLLQSLARNAEQPAASKTLIRDMTADAENPALSAETVDDYLESLRRVFVLEEIASWSPNLRSPLRINKKPKYHFVDPSLPAAILGAGVEALMGDLELFGLLFEGLCTRDLLVYAEAMGASVRYYRDASGLEVDAIVEQPDGSWGAVEIKLGHNQADAAATHLLKLRDRVVDAGGRPPAFLATVEGLSSYALVREDGVLTIPITTLGA